MRAFRNEEKSNIFSKYYKSILICFFIVLVFIFYAIVWMEIKNRIIKILNINNAKYELKYDNIKVSGFPVVLNGKIDNLEVKILKNNSSVKILFDRILIRNFIFTKNVNINFLGNIKIINTEGKINNTLTLGKHIIEFSLDKNNKIDSFDSFVEKIANENYLDGKLTTTSELNNVTLKFVTVNDFEYKDKTMRINIDSIISKNDNNTIESNFELIFSNVSEYKGEDIVSVRNKIDTFVFNDITNNYSISIDGGYSVSSYTRSSKIDLSGKITNYNYLISAVNKEKVLLFDKDLVSNFVQVLELIPRSEKDTRTDRYFTINTDTKAKSFYINNIDINKLITKLMFKNEDN